RNPDHHSDTDSNAYADSYANAQTTSKSSVDGDNDRFHSATGIYPTGCHRWSCTRNSRAGASRQACFNLQKILGTDAHSDANAVMRLTFLAFSIAAAAIFWVAPSPLAAAQTDTACEIRIVLQSRQD